eukprot:3542601-Rhodomonas_salina.1
MRTVRVPGFSQCCATHLAPSGAIDDSDAWQHRQHQGEQLAWKETCAEVSAENEAAHKGGGVQPAAGAGIRAVSTGQGLSRA